MRPLALAIRAIIEICGIVPGRSFQNLFPDSAVIRAAYVLLCGIAHLFSYDGCLRRALALTRRFFPGLQTAVLHIGTILPARQDTNSGTISRGTLRTDLSPRELDCLLGLACGEGTMEIADRLILADATVNEYVRNAKRKLGARTRAEAVARAVILGLIEP